MSAGNILSGPPCVIGVGLASFVEDLRSQGIAACAVDWRPPAVLDPKSLQALDVLLDEPHAARIERANQSALARLFEADPVLVDVVRAEQVIPELRERLVLHAGPPVEWPAMCGPMRGAVAGAIVFEGWAPDLDSAMQLAASGAIRFMPNHTFGAVGPMTGITTQSMAVMVVENRAFGNRAYCTLNEGLGKVMRFGGNDASVRERLHWLANSCGPALSGALRALDGVPLKNLVARGLTMGDEMHQRNVACTSLFLRAVAPALVKVSRASSELERIVEFIASNDQFFLNIAMAMGKAMTDPIRNIDGSSVVSAMARNGTEFGIKVSGLGDEWFVAPVEMPAGLYFPGFSADDANPDMGDSTIVETIGLGGFAMAAAPAVAGFVGAGDASVAVDTTHRMYEITCARNPEWGIPALDFQGVPSGIDVRRVVQISTPPTINTGIAHREPGVGQVGAGVVRAPMQCFERALTALAERLVGLSP